MAPFYLNFFKFYLTLVKYVNTTRIAPDKVQASLPRVFCINNCTLLIIYKL